jgi:hypothetical protein
MLDLIGKPPPTTTVPQASVKGLQLDSTRVVAMPPNISDAAPAKNNFLSTPSKDHPNRT